MPVTLGMGHVTAGLILHLDAGATASYPGSGRLWRDISGNGNDFVVSANAYNSGGPKYMDFGGSYGCAKSVNRDLGPFNQDMTIICWTNIRNSTSEWRTLVRGLSTGGDHNVIIESGAWRMGMYDNVNGTGFNTAGFSQQSLPHYGTSNFDMLIWRWNHAGSNFHDFSYNDTPGTIRYSMTSSNTRYKSGICSIGAYNNGDQNNANNSNQPWGNISVFMLYNRRLTDAECLQNYNAYAVRHGKSVTVSNSFPSPGLTFNDGTVQKSHAVATDPGQLISITTFTSSGTFTAPAGCNKVLVKVQAGGGGSAGHFESGGAGGYAEALIPFITAGTTVSVTVGGGGGGVGYYAAAGQGGTSSFGSYVSCTGGYGANQNYSHTGGLGGLTSGGQVAINGGAGHGHGNGWGSYGPRGVASYWGGGFGTRHSGGEQIGPGAYGAGASSGTTGNGGSGKTAAGGLVIVYSYT